MKWVNEEIHHNKYLIVIKQLSLSINNCYINNNNNHKSNFFSYLKIVNLIILLKKHVFINQE